MDIAHLIECAVEIDLSVFLSSDPFVCNRCYKRLLRFEKAKTNLRSFQEEIKEDFKKGANRTKRLRRNSAEKDGDIENINVPIESSTTLQVQQRSVAKSLKFEQFPTTSTSSNAENDRTVGKSYDSQVLLLSISAQERPSTSEDLFISLPPSLHLTSIRKPVTSIHNQGQNLVTQQRKYQFNTCAQVNRLTSICHQIMNPSAKLSCVKIYRGSKFAALIEKCAVIGLIK